MTNLRLMLLRWLALGWVGLIVLTGCTLPQVKAEDRLFLPLSAEVLTTYLLPQQQFQSTTVGGLSAIAYDPNRDQLYALSDDKGQFGPPRFYTLSLHLDLEANQSPHLDQVQIEAVTLLQDQAGQPYPAGLLDPEGMALSPRQTVFISSEGNPSQQQLPFIGEFDQATGRQVSSVRLPERLLTDDPQQPTRGIQANRGLESLTINASTSTGSMIEPFRLFTATESSLVQDYNPDPSQPLPCRFLHYLIGANQATLIAEHLYLLDLEPSGALVNGLTDLLSIDPAGHFLALERAYGLKGFRVKLYQLATGGATDTSSIVSLAGNLEGVSPIRKRLLLDLNQVMPDVDNLEGISLGPRLADGSQSLLLLSDNNFEVDRPTQILLLRLNMD